MEEFGEQTEGLLKDNRLRFVAAGVLFIGLFVLAVGAGVYYFESNKGEEVKIISGGSSPLVSSEIVVDIEGAVNKPGVYKLVSDSRVTEAIEKAGGLASDADKNKINLAARLTDGQKIVVASLSQNSINQSQNSESEAGNTRLIDVNNASSSELDTLPGIGPVTAGKIIAARPYSTISDLVSKKAVTASVFEKIKDLISAY